MRPLLPTHLLSMLCTLCCLLACSEGGSSGGGTSLDADAPAPCSVGCDANEPLDRDGDGAMDYVLCGDFDGDGRLTMDLGCQNADPDTPCDAPGAKGDLLGCLEALDDADGRTLEILPGRYEVPDEPFTAHHGPAFGGEAGILEIPSNTTVRCRPGAVLMGTDERHLQSPDQLSVLYVPESSTGVVIEDCEVDGGWPDDFSCSGARCFPVARMGIFLKGTGNVVRNNVVHHTRHSCIYTKDGSFNEISGNDLDWCGGAWSSTSTGRYPGIYVFSDDGVPVESVVISDNRCDHTSSACINTRLQHDSDRNRIRGLIVERNAHVATGPNADGSIPPCMLLRGLEGAEFRDNLCEGTGGVSLVPGDGRYLGDPGCSRAAGTWTECVNASRDVALRRTTIRDTQASSPLWIGGFLEDILVEDLVVEGQSTGICLQAVGPTRGLAVQGAQLEACRDGAVRIGTPGVAGSWGESDPEETLDLFDVEVRDADGTLLDGRHANGIRFAQGCVGCRIENLLVSGWTAYGISVDPGHAFRDNDFVGVALEQMGSWHAGTAIVSQLPACHAGTAGLAYTVVDAGGPSSCSAGAGAVSNLCVCDGAVWRDTDQLGATLGASPGIHLLDAGEVSGNLFQDVRCTDVRRRGHCIEAPATASGNVFDGLLGEDTRGLAPFDPQLEDANDGVLNLRGALGNDVQGATCEGLRSGQAADARPCVCLDGASC